MKQRVIEWVKKETVLSVAAVLAVISMMLVKPDAAYGGYVDDKTLAMLFCLMLVMAGFQKLGVFAAMGESLINRVNGEKGIAAVLVFLCFFTSMVITNDVALITFVPFALTVLALAGLERLVIPVVILQTIAANLGSMLTPIGNPQNLYLYGKAGMGAGEFVGLMLPYVGLAGAMLLVCVMCLKCGGGVAVQENEATDSREQRELHKVSQTNSKQSQLRLAAYLVLFALCIGTVAHLLPWPILLAVVSIVMLLLDRELFKRVDYALLATFAAFFIFIGNMGRVPVFYEFLNRVVQGNEVAVSVLASQIISNVPAALLLSGFTDHWQGLIIGTNLGGLGTLIASMASLISYKNIVRAYPEKKGVYLLWFTVANVGFLMLMFAYEMIV